MKALHRAGAVLALAAMVACVPQPSGVEQAARLYQDGKYAGAYDALRAAARERGMTPEIAYDLGVTLYRLRRYEQAAARFREALAGAPELRQSSYYDLGNALVRAAEDTSDIRGPLRQAIEAYQQALILSPGDAAAKWNLELALRRVTAQEEAGGGGGPRQRGNWGRGNMTKAGYAGAPEAATGATAGGGYGAGQGESVRELSPSDARELVEGARRDELKTHGGRNVPHGPGAAGYKDW